ncbi:hypothetical protein EXQ42_01760 [Clostridium botulinum]|nr:hypothetical protein [Clostridium botulinum]MBO0573711.1 hypothetical protein [Clostridium botulinum]
MKVYKEWIWFCVQEIEKYHRVRIYTLMNTIEDEILAYEKTKEVYKDLYDLTKDEKNIIEALYLKSKTINNIDKH